MAFKRKLEEPFVGLCDGVQSYHSDIVSNMKYPQTLLEETGESVLICLKPHDNNPSGIKNPKNHQAFIHTSPSFNLHKMDVDAFVSFLHYDEDEPRHDAPCNLSARIDFHMWENMLNYLIAPHHFLDKLKRYTTFSWSHPKTCMSAWHYAKASQCARATSHISLKKNIAERLSFIVHNEGGSRIVPFCKEDKLTFALVPHEVFRYVDGKNAMFIGASCATVRLMELLPKRDCDFKTPGMCLPSMYLKLILMQNCTRSVFCGITNSLESHGYTLWFRDGVTYAHAPVSHPFLRSVQIKMRPYTTLAQALDSVTLHCDQVALFSEDSGLSLSQFLTCQSYFAWMTTQECMVELDADTLAWEHILFHKRATTHLAERITSGFDVSGDGLQYLVSKFQYPLREDDIKMLFTEVKPPTNATAVPQYPHSQQHDSDINTTMSCVETLLETVMSNRIYEFDEITTMPNYNLSTTLIDAKQTWRVRASEKKYTTFEDCLNTQCARFHVNLFAGVQLKKAINANDLHDFDIKIGEMFMDHLQKHQGIKKDQKYRITSMFMNNNLGKANIFCKKKVFAYPKFIFACKNAGWGWDLNICLIWKMKSFLSTTM